MDKIDFAKTHPARYSAKHEPEELEPDEGTFLSVGGQGEPGGAAWGDAIGELYGVAYTSKLILLQDGVIDFAVGGLEALWDFDDPGELPRDAWRWRLLIRVPDALEAAHVEAATAHLRVKKGVDASAVTRVTFREGRSLQVLHVGPYAALGATYAALARACRARGLAPTGPAHEIYLNDARRARPQELLTIVRLPVAAG